MESQILKVSLSWWCNYFPIQIWEKNVFARVASIFRLWTSTNLLAKIMWNNLTCGSAVWNSPAKFYCATFHGCDYSWFDGHLRTQQDCEVSWGAGIGASSMKLREHSVGLGLDQPKLWTDQFRNLQCIMFYIEILKQHVIIYRFELGALC